MDTHTTQLFQLEADVNRPCLGNDVKTKHKKEEDDEQHLVVNTISGRCHVTLFRFVLPVLWKIRCIELRGLAYYEERQTPTDGYKQLCDNCLHNLRAQRKHANAVRN